LFEERDNTKEQLINALAEINQYWIESIRSSGQVGQKRNGKSMTSSGHIDWRRITCIRDSKNLFF